MKAPFYAVAATLAMVGLAACSGNNCSSNSAANTKGDIDEVYTGVLPAADAAGVRYTLKLDYDDDAKNMHGDYDLVETYLVTDSVGTLGVRDGVSYKSEGDFTSTQKDGKTYLTLVQDKKDSSAGSVGGPLYFLVESDSTLVMVNADLQPSAADSLNYTLTKVK